MGFVWCAMKRTFSFFSLYSPSPTQENRRAGATFDIWDVLKVPDGVFAGHN